MGRLIGALMVGMLIVAEWSALYAWAKGKLRR